METLKLMLQEMVKEYKETEKEQILLKKQIVALSKVINDEPMS